MYLLTDEEDAALVKRCVEGDGAAFEPLVQRHQRALFNVAYRLLGDYDQAADATQNTFVKAYQHLDAFDGSHRFFSWIYRILKNDCLNTLRDRRPSEPLPASLAAKGGPGEMLDAADRHRAVQGALLHLPPEHREVIVLRHFSDLSYDDIGAALGIPPKTVKSRLYSARQRLGELLADWKA